MKNQDESETLCSNCGAKARIVAGGRYPFKESGLSNLELVGIDLIKCPKCKNIDPIIPHMDGLMRCIASAVVMKPFKLRGDEVRFLRKYLNMTGDKFAGLLSIDRSTLSKWETDNDPVGEQSDRLIRAIVVGLGEGLKETINDTIWAFQAERKPQDSSIQVDPTNQTYEYV